MGDYLLLMHNDTQLTAGDWEPYLAALEAGGHLRGGSAIGGGACFRKQGDVPAVSAHLTGFVRVDAASLEAAAALLAGNPVYEAGGTVEIRELPRTD